MDSFEKALVLDLMKMITIEKMIESIKEILIDQTDLLIDNHKKMHIEELYEIVLHNQNEEVK